MVSEEALKQHGTAAPASLAVDAIETPRLTHRYRLVHLNNFQ
jgi:hypothetical protein